MKIVERLVYAVLVLALIAVSVVGFLGSLGLLPNLGADLNRVFTDPSLRWITALVTGVLIVVGVFLFGMSLRREPGVSAVVTRTSLGDVSITLHAFESLVLRAAKQVDGVRDLRPSVRSGREGILINLRAATLPDVSIPRVSDELQEVVKRQVEALTGVNVQEVRVIVEDISYDIRTRVE
jgi:uncharacterized alkaline shock family protein YloU